jgi:DNA repair protein RadA
MAAKKKSELDEEILSGKDDFTELPGVGPAMNEKLATRYSSFMELATQSPKNIAEMCEITEASAKRTIEAAQIKANIGDFILSSELKEKRAQMHRLTTSSTQLDSLFGGGGLPTGAITEFFGEFGCGKTQICFQLAVNATMPIEQGGLDGHVVVIDTENTFRPNRIDQIATAQGLDIDEVNKKIHVAHAFNSSHQMLLLSQKAKELAKQVPVKLVIVDSLTSHFRSEYIGRGCLADRQGLLNKHMREILNFCDVNNAAAVVTNQVLTNPAVMYGDPTKPVGGNIVGHNSTYRLYIRKSKDKRTVLMVDSPENPALQVIVSISEEGVRDG